MKTTEQLADLARRFGQRSECLGNASTEIAVALAEIAVQLSRMNDLKERELANTSGSCCLTKPQA